MQFRIKSKHLWIGLGVGSAVGAACLYASRATAHYLMRLALDREAPPRMAEQKSRIRGMDYGEEAEQMLSEAARRLEAREPRRVELISSDGIRLVGHWLQIDHPRRVLIAMHGWRSSWSRDFGPIADFWLNNGCSILFAEQRGQNDSEGDCMGFGLLERHDCLDWIRWADREVRGTLPIYPAGISMGATTVLMASGLELPPCVRGIIADCGFTSPRAIWKHVVEDHLHMPYGLYASTAEQLCKKRLNVGAGECSAADALRSCTVPVLFIHGTEDSFVPVEMTYENYKSCAAPKRLFVVPGANHGMSYCMDREGYERNTLEFWAEAEEKD